MLPLLAALLLSADGLRLEEPTLRQFEDGPPFEQAYRPGEQVFLDLRVAGYGRTEGENPELKLKWTIRALDSDGRLLEPPYTGRAQASLTNQDTEYRPRARFSALIPSFALEGLYKIVVQVTDEVADKTVEGTYPFRVRGKQLAKGAPLTAGNWRFYRQEDDPAALSLPVYRQGAQVWMKFDLEGYKLSATNAFQVEFGVTVIGPDGKEFLKQDPAATERGQPAYPQPYVPATYMIQLPPQALPGDYRVLIRVKDLTQNAEQTAERSFRVE